MSSDKRKLWSSIGDEKPNKERRQSLTWSLSFFFLGSSVIHSPIASGDRGGLFGAGGRFKGGVDPIMEKFNESISFDKR